MPKILKPAKTPGRFKGAQQTSKQWEPDLTIEYGLKITDSLTGRPLVKKYKNPAGRERWREYYKERNIKTRKI